MYTGMRYSAWFARSAHYFFFVLVYVFCGMHKGFAVLCNATEIHPSTKLSRIKCRVHNTRTEIERERDTAYKSSPNSAPNQSYVGHSTDARFWWLFEWTIHVYMCGHRCWRPLKGARSGHAHDLCSYFGIRHAKQMRTCVSVWVCMYVTRHSIRGVYEQSLQSTT